MTENEEVKISSHITERVVMAAAGNAESGVEVMKLCSIEEGTKLILQKT